MAFNEAFVELARNPTAAPLSAKLHIRLNDNAGQPGTLLTITDTQTILALPEISRQREKDFGVIRGQVWQVQITNIDLAVLGQSLVGCWAIIEGGFLTANLWDGFAGGKIRKVTPTTEGVVTLEVHDAVMDVLNFELPREIRFQSSGWISPVSVVRKGPDSETFDNDNSPVVLNTPAAADDETFKIEFTTPTAYKVILEDGTESQTGVISANLTINNLAADTSIVTIPSAGWDQATAAYAVGDLFVFYTARARTTAELSPVNMVAHLITDVAQLSSYDVLTGSAYSSPLFDIANWTAHGTATSGDTIAGTFRKGTRLISLIQDALKIPHGTIYPSPTGQIALYALSEASGGGLLLNGDPNAGTVDIIRMEYYDELKTTVSEITYEYLSLDGTEANYTATAENSVLLAPNPKTVSIGWEVRGLSIEAACNRYLTRFEVPRRVYTIYTTLAGAVADIASSVIINEPELGLRNVVSSVSQVAINILRNSAKITAFADPFVTQNFAKVGEATVGGPDVIW